MTSRAGSARRSSRRTIRATSSISIARRIRRRCTSAIPLHRCARPRRSAGFIYMAGGGAGRARDRGAHRRVLAALSQSHRYRAMACVRRTGRALLWDAHSIASEIPSLFEGVLPEFNLGTRDGASSARNRRRVARYRAARWRIRCGAQRTLQGRLHHRPLRQARAGVYAVQLELARRAYMNEDLAQVWDPQHAQRAQA